MPLIASIAALFILVLIGSQFIGNKSISMDNSAMEQKAFKGEEKAESTSIEDAEGAAGRSMIENFSADVQAPQTLVYESQLEGVTLFEIGLAGDDAESVPVSFLIPNEVITNKLGTEKPTKLQLYETFAPLIDEESLGFKEYHLLKGTFREEGKKLIHTLPKDHDYDKGSAALSNYMGALVDTFGDSYDEVQLESASGEEVYLDHIGEMTEAISLNSKSTQYNYFAYQMRDGTMYLSPNFRMSYSNIEEAIENMTVEANDIYQTVILPEVSMQVEDQGEIVKITFDEPLDMEQYEPTQVMRMIEGLLLTSASFDKQIKFEQIVQTEWSGFDFTKPLEKPIGANIVFYNF